MWTLFDDTTSLNLDDYYVTLDTGLPKVSYKFNEIIGDGSELSGNGLVNGRIIKITRAFTKSKYADRDLWIDWFTRPFYQEIYLRMQTSSFNGVQRVYPALDGGESYASKNFTIIKEISFNLFMPDPYFESTTYTGLDIGWSILSSTEHFFTFNIDSHKIFPTIYFKPNSYNDYYSAKTNNNYGFEITYPIDNRYIDVFSSNSELKAYTDINTIPPVYDDTKLISGYFTPNSSPIEFRKGSNTLRIKTNCAGVAGYYYLDRRL